MRLRAADIVFTVFATALLALFLAGCGEDPPPPVPPAEPPVCSCDPMPKCLGTVVYVDEVLTCVPPACPEPPGLPTDCRGCHSYHAAQGRCPRPR